MPKTPFRLARQQVSGRAASGLAFCLSLALLPMSGLVAPLANASTAPDSKSASTGASIGHVSLLVGQARVQSMEGQWVRLERGSSVHVGDRIETQTGGHVHLQFVDGGRVSVRPASRLHIEDYSAPNSAKPGSGAIRFRLEEGVVRSITGRWGEEARERFRLNTPLAAIGVKGTDFAVRSDGNATAASVYTGAIVVSHLDASCAGTVGPCANGTEKLLSAAMRGQMLELSRSQPAPQLVPAVDLLAAGTRAALPTVARAETRGSEAVAAVALSAGTSPDSTKSSGSVERPVVTESLAATAVKTAVAPPVVEQMVWIRPGAAAVGDTLSAAFSPSAVSDKRATIGSLSYTLYASSAPFSAAALVGAGESAAAFRLAGGGASLIGPSGVALEAVQVSAGSLRLDFARQSFSTGLTLQGALTGLQEFQATGALSNAGYFFGLGDQQFLAGAVNANGKEAGYLFEKRVDPGIVRGITLWGR